MNTTWMFIKHRKLETTSRRSRQKNKWYANSELDENNWFAEDLRSHRKQWPGKGMIHSESSIDIDADDPIGQYWRESTDYAGTFVPFDTYAYDIITDLNAGTQGYWKAGKTPVGQQTHSH